MKTIYRAADGKEFDLEHLCVRYEELCMLAGELNLHHIADANVIEVLTSLDKHPDWLLQNVSIKPA